MSDILSQFGIDTSVFSAIINEPDILESSSSTTMLRLDREVPYKGSINGKSVDAYVTLREARLTRLSLLKQTQKSTNRDYWLVTGVMQPVQLDIDLMIEGNRINLIDVLHQIAEASAGQSITRDAFLMNARKIGLNFIEGQPLFFQQFGANFDKFAEVIEVFKAHGAKDVVGNIKNNTGRIQAAYELKPGMPISAFEVGTVDRTKSARYNHDQVGQGFENLISAQFEQFTRILGLRKSAKIKRAEAEKSNDEKQTISLSNSADLDMKMARMATSNWAGAQRRIRQLSNGDFEVDPIFDPVNLPCGRFTVVTNDGIFEADLWTNNKTNMSELPTLKTDTEAEPF